MDNFLYNLIGCVFVPRKDCHFEPLVWFHFLCHFDIIGVLNDEKYTNYCDRCAFYTVFFSFINWYISRPEEHRDVEMTSYLITHYTFNV